MKLRAHLPESSSRGVAAHAGSLPDPRPRRVFMLVAALIAALVAPMLSSVSAAQATFAPGDAPYINTWLLAGSLTDASADPAASPKEGDAIGDREWEYFDDRLYNRNGDDYQDIYGYFKVKQGQTLAADSTAYALSYVYSPTARAAEFRIGSSGTHEVWVNGSLAGASTSSPEVNKDTDKFTIALTGGWNRIQVKLIKGSRYYWGFYGRVTDSSGNEISDLQYSTAPGGGALAIATKKLSVTDNALPNGYAEWPYVERTSPRGTQGYRPQASKFRLLAQGGTPGYSWELHGGHLPDGLALTDDGTISGTVSAKPGLYPFVVQVTDAAGSSQVKNFKIEIKERPNKWIQHAGQVALVSAGAGYTASVDQNFSADAWAERMKRQGIQGVYFEAGQQSSVWWPSVHQVSTTPDYITQYMDAVKRYDIRWGMYYPSEGGGRKHHSSSGFVQDVEDLILRYGNPAQWFFDGNPFGQGNTDAMYSIVRDYGDEALILPNDQPDQGDADLKVTENERYWGNVTGEREPWRSPDGKLTFIDAWRHPFNKVFGLWSVYHGGQVRNDWRNFAKANIIEIATGQMADFDQAIAMGRGVVGSGANPSMPADVFPMDAQMFIDMREAYATWINSRLESIVGTEPRTQSEGSWGYATERGNLIYLHVLDAPAPANKTGMPSGPALTVEGIDSRVTKVFDLSTGESLPFEWDRSASVLTVTTEGLATDAIDTIIKVVTTEPPAKLTLTGITLNGERSGASVKLAVEGYLDEYSGLAPELEVGYTSSDEAVATVSASGVVTGAGQGSATITATATRDGVTATDSLTVAVDGSGAVRVADELQSAVLHLGGKELYYGKLYHHDSTAQLTVEGLSTRGGATDTGTAETVYHTDRPELIQVTPAGVVSSIATVKSDQRAAIWAEVTLGGKTVTSNKVFLDVSDERLLSQDRTTTASDSDSGHGPDQAVDGVAYPADGSSSSRWSTGDTSDAWWQVDLGETRNISTVDLYFNHRNDAYRNVPKSVTFQVSEDGTHWETAVSKWGGVPANGAPSAIEPVTAKVLTPGRYLRLAFEDGVPAGVERIDLLEVGVWVKDVLPPLNTARKATATASTVYDGRYPASKVNDGIVGESPSGEWVSAGEQQPWVQLDWAIPQTLNTVVLVDRINTTDNVSSGTLSFSDGSTVAVDWVDAAGAPKAVTFPEKEVSWVRFTADGGEGSNVGLSEIETYLDTLDVSDYRARWAFDNNGSDSSPNGFTASLTGAAGYTSDSRDGSGALVGTGGSGAKTSGLVTTTTDNLTLSTWVRWEGATSNHQQILYNGQSNTGGYGLFLNHGNGDKLSILAGGVSVLSSQVTLPVGQWTHLAAVRGDGAWQLYVNGQSVAITDASAVPKAPTGSATYIGNDQTGSAGFKGRIDDARVYERAFSVQEIWRLNWVNSAAAETENPPEQSDYRAKWSFDGDGVDSGTSSFDVTLTGAASYSTDAKEGTGSLATVGGGSGAKTGALVTTAIDDLTLSSWVRWSGATANHQQILYNGQSNAGGFGLFLHHGEGDRLGILLGGTSVLSSQVNLPVGQWTHLAAVRRAGIWELYVDGESVAITNSGATPSVPTGVTYIGNDQTAAAGFNGLIDDARIYERPLTVAEVQELLVQ